MPEPTFFCLTATAWTALATVAMGAAAIASVVVSVKLMKSQDRVIDIQNRLTELQRRANWLSGSLESYSQVMLRLKAEDLGKTVLWWDPTHDGLTKKRPPPDPVHLQDAAANPVYVYVPEEFRRHPDIT
jgi:hypothetical protein